MIRSFVGLLGPLQQAAPRTAAACFSTGKKQAQPEDYSLVMKQAAEISAQVQQNPPEKEVGLVTGAPLEVFKRQVGRQGEVMLVFVTKGEEPAIAHACCARAPKSVHVLGSPAAQLSKQLRHTKPAGSHLRSIQDCLSIRQGQDGPQLSISACLEN